MDQPCPQQNHCPGSGRVGGRRYGVNMKKTGAVLFFSFFSLLCLLSCGLEDFPFIDYIANSTMDTTVRATIRLPSSSDDGYSTYFAYFIIFYRIYISDIPETALIASTSTNNVFNQSLNTALNSDFSALYSLTDKISTNVSTANIENTFLSSRKYFLLSLEGVEINNILSRDSLGKTLEIAFPPNAGSRPTLSLSGGTPYVLQRNRDLMQPMPRDRYFLNHPDLYNTANVTDQINADVAINTKTNTEFRYTYVSMYIAAKGNVYNPLPQVIYSQPTFIGVFRLADSS